MGAGIITASASGVNVTGVITATTFDGSGASLDSIPNSALDNSSVSYGGVSLSLGGSDATPAFDLSDATNYPYTSLTGISTEIVGDTSPQLGGSLDLNSNSITGSGNIFITGVTDLTGILYADTASDGSLIFNRASDFISVTGVKFISPSGSNIKLAAAPPSSTVLIVVAPAEPIAILK